MDASQNKGSAIKKEDTHKMADQKSFCSFQVVINYG